MKAILISTRSPHVCNILNLIKWWEIRKKFFKDYVGWVYIYCTKNGGMAYKGDDGKYHVEKIKNYFPHYCINGKVVARFWCDKVEKIKYHFGYYDMGEWSESYILENSCLTAEELDDYLQASKEYDETKVSRVYGYGIHITKLEIFDEPKEISEFQGTCNKSCAGYKVCKIKPNCNRPLTRAPQSWCYIEV